MDRSQLIHQIFEKESFLCVGLDSDFDRLPDCVKSYDDPQFEFNKRIIDATKDYCIAYKPNTAFYECRGSKGWDSLKKTLEYIPENIFTIADAKRGDIGNTSRMYAQTFFEDMSFDSVTVAPYMGIDSVSPFLSYENHWTILLALTSNEGANDFQLKELSDGETLYKKVLGISQSWGNENNLMYVVGATKSNYIKEIRDIVPNHFLLVPGVGAQGGDLHNVAKNGFNKDCGLIINSSRQIIFADSGEHFDEAASRAAQSVQQEMAQLLTTIKR